MKPTTADELTHTVNELNLVSSESLHEICSEQGGRDMSLDQCAQAFVRRELLTSYQLDRLLRGERTGFFYGRAKVLYQTGAGSFARVFRAINVETRAIVAVKVLRSRFSADSEKCKAFRREGEMGHLLRHPNIVAIEDVGQERDTSYITMEFVEGQTLRELVRIRGAIDIDHAIRLIVQLLEGLEYAHRRGVTHRDLKASNVLVSSSGQGKLVDFGLAGIDSAGDKSLGKMVQPRTIDYAALEKLSGMNDDSIRSDIYFLGTIAYLALSGTSALLESRDRAERADPRRFTSVMPLATRAPRLPRELIDTVSRMIHLDPLERWQNAADVRRALESLVGKYTADKKSADGNATADPSTASPVAKSALGTPAYKGRLMLVEPSGQAQAALREFFTRLGYRVLLTENPDRALTRFSSTPVPADCLIMSTQSLGKAAIEAFNKLTENPFLADIPAILIASSKQQGLIDQAHFDDRRKLVLTPIHMKEVDRILDSLLHTQKANTPSSSDS